MADPNPWAVLTGAIEPPPWQGEAHVHLMGDDDVPQPIKPPVATLAPAPAPDPAPVVKSKRELKEEAAGIRTCSKCRRTYPATPEYFYRSKRELGGLRRECKTCFGEHPSSKAPRRTEPSAEKSQALQQLARRCVATILSVLPAWTLIEPGSEKEAFARKVPPCVWWPRLETTPLPTHPQQEKS